MRLVHEPCGFSTKRTVNSTISFTAEMGDSDETGFCVRTAFGNTAWGRQLGVPSTLCPLSATGLGLEILPMSPG
jgi:hypothetical protein